MAREKVARPTPRAASEGCVLLAAPAGVDACSVDGTAYRVADGVVEVPEQAAPFLEPHGFTRLEREA